MATAVGQDPEDLPLSIYCGDRWEHPFHFVDEAGDPVDVSGYSWAAQVRTSQTASSAEADFSFDTTDAVTGVVVMYLTKADTAALLTPGEGKSSKSLTWDLQRTLIADPEQVRTLYSGAVTVTLDRTR